MEERLAVISVLVEDGDKVEEINQLLHSYGGLVRGRLGLPKVYESASVITLVVVGPQPEISALTGKVGALEGVTCQALYSKK